MDVFDLRADPEVDLTPVVAHLMGEKPVAYPTETVYGLGGICTPAATRRVLELKGRSGERPLLALVESAQSVEGLSWTDPARELASIFWPGALTLVLADPDHIFPKGVRNQSTGAVGVRVSPHPVVTRLVRTVGRPLTSTSLNISGEAPAASAGEARDVLDRMAASDVWLLDGGTLPASGPSTVVDCTGAIPVVLRTGTIPMERLRCAIPEIHGRSVD